MNINQIGDPIPECEGCDESITDLIYNNCLVCDKIVCNNCTYSDPDGDYYCKEHTYRG